MKKFIAAIVAIALTATPVMAHPDNFYRGNRGNNTGAVIAGVVGGILLGTIISNSNRDFRDTRNNGYYVPSPPPVPEAYAYVRCHYEEVYDQYGRVFYRRICQR